MWRTAGGYQDGGGEDGGVEDGGGENGVKKDAVRFIFLRHDGKLIRKMHACFFSRHDEKLDIHSK